MTIMLVLGLSGAIGFRELGPDDAEYDPHDDRQHKVDYECLENT